MHNRKQQITNIADARPDPESSANGEASHFF